MDQVTFADVLILDGVAFRFKKTKKKKKRTKRLRNSKEGHRQ